MSSHYLKHLLSEEPNQHSQTSGIASPRRYRRRPRWVPYMGLLKYLVSELRSSGVKNEDMPSRLKTLSELLSIPFPAISSIDDLVTDVTDIQRKVFNMFVLSFAVRRIRNFLVTAWSAKMSLEEISEYAEHTIPEGITEEEWEEARKMFWDLDGVSIELLLEFLDYASRSPSLGQDIADAVRRGYSRAGHKEILGMYSLKGDKDTYLRSILIDTANRISSLVKRENIPPRTAAELANSLLRTVAQIGDMFKSDSEEEMPLLKALKTIGRPEGIVPETEVNPKISGRDLEKVVEEEAGAIERPRLKFNPQNPLVVERVSSGESPNIRAITPSGPIERDQDYEDDGGGFIEIPDVDDL